MPIGYGEDALGRMQEDLELPLPTAKAIAFLRGAPKQTNAIVHFTC